MTGFDSTPNLAISISAVTSAGPSGEIERCPSVPACNWNADNRHPECIAFVTWMGTASPVIMFTKAASETHLRNMRRRGEEPSCATQTNRPWPGTENQDSPR